ncbi:aminotransferase class V-fold PLP-dependent enzyme [Spiroplasma alleghenense]|uniref:Cysteine desulfurase n=1 Tax=Spiroplasma alleghenense TaxID=216931 RepID=A0A345Z3Z1_9MOLU|nr:aminotransferase class V-fold PLP-dependent enzyme [Spiroplasma alleghenense]AXK51320.1 cysteine desulfurase [Spiroplasma alleghenense]
MKEFTSSFPYLRENPNVVYFDNAATSLKPQIVIDAEKEYLEKIAANPHTLDYGNAFRAWEVLDITRNKALQFLKSPDNSQVIFTSGTTHSLNQVAFGLQNMIEPGDEILTTTLEHSSTLLPFLEVSRRNKALIKLLPLQNDGRIQMDEIANQITKKTKLVAFASSTNVLGGFNDVEKIVKAIRKVNPEIIVVIDAAQSIAHEVTDLKKWDADLVAFSAHKVFGPFGVGVLWGKTKILEKLVPIFYGGGMSGQVEGDLSSFELQELPARLEGGTPNISGIYGFSKALDFIEAIGFENIVAKENELKEYAIQKAKQIPHDLATFYNLDNNSPILTFNIRDYNPQDIATFFWVKYGIQVRSGSHCARIVKNQNIPPITVRASFSFFNTKEEIDKLFEAIKNSDNFLEAIL